MLRDVCEIPRILWVAEDKVNGQFLSGRDGSPSPVQVRGRQDLIQRQGIAEVVPSPRIGWVGCDELKIDVFSRLDFVVNVNTYGHVFQGLSWVVNRALFHFHQDLHYLESGHRTNSSKSGPV